MMRFVLPLIFLFPMSVFAASNEETLQYIIADFQDQCEKAQEDFRDINLKEGDPVVAELELSEGNLYEVTIDKDGKTATVLHARFACTNIGYPWCGSGGCDSYVIVEGESYTSWGGKPVSVQHGERYVVLIPRGGLACHNSADIGFSNAAPCYTATVWDSSHNTSSIASSRLWFLTVSSLAFRTVVGTEPNAACHSFIKLPRSSPC